MASNPHPKKVARPKTATPTSSAFPRRQFLKNTCASASLLALPSAGCHSTRRPFTGSLLLPNHSLGHKLRDSPPPSPSPSSQIHTRILIIGAGIAGLSAARHLALSGHHDFLLCDLESHPGGNSHSGALPVSPFPWGAHYVPIPSTDSPEILQLFRDLGVIDGDSSPPDPAPIYKEQFLCHDPSERLYLHGRWQEGLLPRIGASAQDDAEMNRFSQFIESIRLQRGNDGRPLFAIPAFRSSTDPQWCALDQIRFSEWLDQQGYRSPLLRWHLSYCCRDDFGAGPDRVSAWAGLFYFAARRGVAANADSHTVLTWPQGNGWLVEQLRQPSLQQWRPNTLALRLAPDNQGVTATLFDAAKGAPFLCRAEAAILAAPNYIARRILAPELLPNLAASSPKVPLDYFPWLVANLWVKRIPRGRGAPPAWDNVLFDSPGLGYVIATHQNLHPTPGESILTYYRPLDSGDPQSLRQSALATSWNDWVDQILGDLRTAHSDLPDLVRNIDVRIWGHGMICPSPGVIRPGHPHPNPALPEFPQILLAHSDRTGLSIFEEAYIQGLQAASSALHWVQTKSPAPAHA